MPARPPRHVDRQLPHGLPGGAAPGRGGPGRTKRLPGRAVAAGEAAVLLRPPLPLVGVSTEAARECQQL